MDAGQAPARQARTQHRHELRTLTYACVEAANGGIVRDINHHGIGLQVVAAVRPQQQVRVRFELQPRLRVETQGEVLWATCSGQCGIRFLELPPKMARRIDQWIFGNLLEEASLHSERAGFLFTRPQFAGLLSSSHDTDAAEDVDGLMVSATPVNVIQLPMRIDRLESAQARGAAAEITPQVLTGFDWLSQPLSGRGLIWTINTLVIVAAVLLFAVVFLSITGEPPRWPLATTGATTILVAALYWGFFRVFGGPSPGARLARLAGWEVEDDEVKNARFR
jgi:hypothetical protein